MHEEAADSLALAQLERIERDLSAPLSDDQRQRVLERLSTSSSWTSELIAAIPDCTEPGFIFRPFRPSGVTPAEGQHDE